MQTLGIDLAAQPEKTGVAWLEWTVGKARVTELNVGASDESLLKAMTTAGKTGIDCPLGWPGEFVAFVSRHQDDHVVMEPGLAADWRRRLCYRVTDLHLKATVPGIQGLSVSSDRIGVTTMRCAALLSQLAAWGAKLFEQEAVRSPRSIQRRRWSGGVSVTRATRAQREGAVEANSWTSSSQPPLGWTSAPMRVPAGHQTMPSMLSLLP